MAWYLVKHRRGGSVPKVKLGECNFDSHHEVQNEFTDSKERIIYKNVVPDIKQNSN
jgi:hypothetical protein